MITIKCEIEALGKIGSDVKGTYLKNLCTSVFVITFNLGNKMFFSAQGWMRPLNIRLLRTAWMSHIVHEHEI